MAGHSQFKNIMHRKGAQDARRAKVFARLTRELQVAARMGLPDPAQNPRLRTAIAAARAGNMPKDNIERAIRKAVGAAAAADFAEVRYEGYGPGGAAVIVEALTDNRNRAAAEIRAAFSKHGGNLGESGSVAFMFDRVGQVLYPPDAADGNAMFEGALEAGAEDVVSDATGHEILCAPDDFHAMREALEERFGAPSESGLVWRPKTTVALDEASAPTMLKLLDALDDSDDVQRVSANFEVADEVMAKLTA